jgi:hypothetical protein
MWHAWGRRGINIGFWWESQAERHQYEDLDVGERIILKWILEIGWDVVNWIGRFQDRDNWWALVNTVMNLRVP